MYPCACVRVWVHACAFVYVRRPHGNHGAAIEFELEIGSEKKCWQALAVKVFELYTEFGPMPKGEALKSRGNLGEDVHTSTLCTMYKSKNWKRQQHRQILIRRNAHTHTHTHTCTPTNTQDKQLEKEGSGEWPSVPFQQAWLPACLRSYVRSADRRGRRTCTQQTNELVLLFCGMCVSRADEREWERG